MFTVHLSDGFLSQRSVRKRDVSDATCLPITIEDYLNVIVTNLSGRNECGELNDDTNMHVDQEEGREGRREDGRERGREGEREGGKEGVYICACVREKNREREGNSHHSRQRSPPVLSPLHCKVALYT